MDIFFESHYKTIKTLSQLKQNNKNKTKISNRLSCHYFPVVHCFQFSLSLFYSVLFKLICTTAAVAAESHQTASWRQQTNSQNKITTSKKVEYINTVQSLTLTLFFVAISLCIVMNFTLTGLVNSQMSAI